VSFGGPNPPENTTDSAPRPRIVRGTGVTSSEKYLAKLADQSFLNLWAYPNTFIDKRSSVRGEGKELCDLLVVCGEHVLIFSDKAVGWPVGEDEKLSWKRWYKRAVLRSVDQIREAQRWITKFPHRIFLDRQCLQPLLIQLPPPDRRKIHGIVVALGAGGACKDHFGEGIGSLSINSTVRGDDHWRSTSVAPFVIGDVDPTDSFVHSCPRRRHAGHRDEGIRHY